MNIKLLLLVFLAISFSACKDEAIVQDVPYTFSLNSDVSQLNPDELKNLVLDLAKEYLSKNGQYKISEFDVKFKGWTIKNKKYYRVDLIHPSDLTSDDVGGGKSLSLRIDFKLKEIREFGFQ